MEAAAPTDAQPAASSDQESGLVRPLVPSLRPPVLISGWSDSGVPETIFAELQAVDLSRAPVLDSEETTSTAPAPLTPRSPPSLIRRLHLNRHRDDDFAIGNITNRAVNAPEFHATAGCWRGDA
jgi:hypothetical protein